VVDTNQSYCFDNRGVIACPPKGRAFHGQDAQYRGTRPAYRANGDGTVSDLNTGLIWQRAHNRRRLSYYDAKRACRGLRLGGRVDWRLPSLKELYSIADFSGAQGARAYLDTAYFRIERPGWDQVRRRPGARHTPQMMGQTWSSTIYVGNLWGRGQEAAFFFNFFDGRIKSAQTTNRFAMFYRCVRGPRYLAANAFQDNGDGTLTDRATGLVWQKTDDGRKRDWAGALRYCEGLKLGGRSDWRLPNAKELQSIVDYRRNDPALDLRIFGQRDRRGWFWTSTTLGDHIDQAIYVCFGKCLSASGIDTHGAGAQRSDPKTGNPARYTSLGGQRDAVRIDNYARCVRGS
jgi:hypothetical protein